MNRPPSAADHSGQNPLGSIPAQLWLWSVIRGVLAIILGIIALVAPISTVITFAILAGILALIDGIVSLIDAIRHRSSGGTTLRVVVSVVDIIFGLLLLFWPGHALTAMVVLVGIWAILLGIGEVVVTLLTRRGRGGWTGGGWVGGLVTGVIAVIFGVVLVAQPGIGLVAVAIVFGVFAILFGLFWIAVGLLLRRTTR